MIKYRETEGLRMQNYCPAVQPIIFVNDDENLIPNEGEMGPKFIVLDFDGTCVTHAYPEIGEDIGAAPVIKKLLDKGHKILLNTMRCDGSAYGNTLSRAVRWFFDNGLQLYGIQENPDQVEWTSSPKVYGHVYIDDAALGCPLIFPADGSRPYVDWKKVEELLIQMEIL